LAGQDIQNWDRFVVKTFSSPLGSTGKLLSFTEIYLIEMYNFWFERENWAARHRWKASFTEVSLIEFSKTSFSVATKTFNS
jgi:hypothetical protein